MTSEIASPAEPELRTWLEAAAKGVDGLSGFTEQGLRAWLENAVRNYVNNAIEPYRDFKPLVIPDAAHLAPVISKYFFLLNSEVQERFRRALSAATLELSPLDPVFTKQFATYCEIAGYIKVAEIVDAIRAHLLVGRLRSPRTELELEAGNIAIQALDMLSPPLPAAAELLRQLYNQPEIRAAHPTALLTAMCEIEPVSWPIFVRDFTYSQLFESLSATPGRLVGIVEDIARDVPLEIIAGHAYRLVDLVPARIAGLLFRAFFSDPECPLVLFTESFLAFRFSQIYPIPARGETAAYRWHMTSIDNFDPDVQRPLDPTSLISVASSPVQNSRADGDFVALLNGVSVTDNIRTLAA
jgi:hypothetical protein